MPDNDERRAESGDAGADVERRRFGRGDSRRRKGSESLILQAAAHLDDDLVMPPRDNKAKAKNLTPEQLGLLKRWIDQGAKDSPKTERIVHWQPLAESPRRDFRGRGHGRRTVRRLRPRKNQVFIYHVPSGRLVDHEAAHRDQVNALAFSPDGTLMASGGYREVKLWRRTKDASNPRSRLFLPKTPRADGSMARLWRCSMPTANKSRRWIMGKRSPPTRCARTGGGS